MSAIYMSGIQVVSYIIFRVLFVLFSYCGTFIFNAFFFLVTSSQNEKRFYALFASNTSNCEEKLLTALQWGSEYRTCPVFKWSTLIRFSNGSVFEWSKNKMAAKALAQTVFYGNKCFFHVYKMVQANGPFENRTFQSGF